MFSYQTPELKTSRYLPQSPVMAPKQGAGEGNDPDHMSQDKAEEVAETGLKPGAKKKPGAKVKPASPAKSKTAASPKKSTPMKRTPMKAAMKSLGNTGPKAKAKAKAKTKAAALKKVLKKPGVKDTGGHDSTSGSLKRPAAGSSSSQPKHAKNSLLALCTKWQQGMAEPKQASEEGEEEEGFEDDPETDPEGTSKRNKYVGLKFSTMRKQGRIPDQILRVVDSEPTRAGKTSLLSKLFKKDKHGNWSMQTNDPAFEMKTTANDTKFGVDQNNSFPRSIMLHHWYGGNEPAFLQALDDGEIFVEQQEGVKGLEDGSSKKTQLALASGSKDDVALSFDKIVSTLQEAKQAQEKLLKDVSKVLPTLQKFPDLRTEYKEACGTLQGNASKLANILTWQEFPDGPLTKKTMDDLMMSLAESTSKAYEKMEQVKAAIKARGGSSK
ncbi:unnamed protein product [Durusdinium trenchii]|uniref:Uncharacterized protein n=1 Tax=Durusdinium trenchii TaxID=1381693 RepID=A0ABP0SSJ9_9DINO